MSILETNSWLFGVPSALRQQQLRNPQGLELVDLVPGLLLNRSGVSMRHERGNKKTGIPYSPLGLSLSGDERNSIFYPLFLDLIQSQLDANWLCCKILRFLLNTNLGSLWKVPNAQAVNRVNGQVGYHPGLSELVSGSSANKLFGESFWMLISVPIGLMYLGPNLEDFLKRPFQLETVDKSVVWWGCLISIVWVWFLNCMDSSWRRVISTLFCFHSAWVNFMMFVTRLVAGKWAVALLW